MIKSKTVFIVGAGASQEVGLPTGSMLKTQMREKLNIRFEHGYTMNSGDPQIENAIRGFIRQETPQDLDINPYLYAAWKIVDALPQALSIDNFLDAHADDKKIQLCGKLGIIRSILEAERASDLYIESGQKVNYGKLEGTWYAQFLKLVTENVRKSDIESLFENVSFITFNYDRCIEQYLVHALANYYAIPELESRRLISKLNVVHPYGQVGNFPFEHQEDSVEFGATGRVNILSIASQIKTFTEQEAAASKLEHMRRLIREAGTLVFLGFAFHELNMQLLDPKTETKVKRVFATGKGISENDCYVVSDDVRSILHEKTSSSIILNPNLTCHELFGTHWRSLSR